MYEERFFIGREKELNEIDQFIKGERPALNKFVKEPPLLLVAGESGIGKWSIFEEVAKRASNKGHYVFCRRIYCVDELENYVNQLIAMLEAVKPNKIGALSHWMKLAFIVGEIVIPQVQSIKDLSELYNHIRQEYETEFCGVEYLGNRFCKACMKLEEKIDENQKIIILLYPRLSPHKKIPEWVIPFLESLYINEISSSVRIILAQRPTGAIISEVDSLSSDELNRLCAKPIRLKQLDAEDSQTFLQALDDKNKLNIKTQKVFLDRYGGWPQLMLLAWEELQELDRITIESILSLPAKIEKYWEWKYNKIEDQNQTKFLHTANLIPHPYPIGEIAEFSTLDLEELELASRADRPVWQLLKREDYPDEYLERILKDCPVPKHPTAKEFVVNHLSMKWSTIYKMRMASIAKCYKKKLLKYPSGEKLNPDALRYILECLIEAEMWNDIKELLTDMNYLKNRREAVQEYLFQRDFARLLKTCPIEILSSILDSVQRCEWSLKEKADWLDTFSYWINEFGVKVELDTERASELKRVANDFDAACAVLSKKLAAMYFSKGGEENIRWALRYAELFTWVYQRAGEYEMCGEACQFAIEMCSETSEEAYQYLAKAEFLRLKAQILKRIPTEKFNESKSKELNSQIAEAYSELMDLYPRYKEETQWPSKTEWEKIEQINREGQNLVLKPPNNSKSATFTATVVSNLDDCIGAMEIINFLMKKGGNIKWIHPKEFGPRHFHETDRQFTILLGGPKAPGASKVAHHFYEYSQENRADFLKMYSGLYCEEKCLKAVLNGTHCYMLGGISKINTLKAAYDFTNDPDVNVIIESLS